MSLSTVKKMDTSVSKEMQTAVNVLKMEADALNSLADNLDDNFVQAIDFMYAANGRVIVTGMGKSGHIARKIAATMASTGTPAFFVHPAEASHGDMGMIVKGDVVIAISNSGESKELGDMIQYTKRAAIPLIGITGQAESTLGTQADLTLLLPEHQEACPNGLAPTTSTTLTLALGDALAVALLEKKGFTSKDYKNYHPGGKLGQQLLSVQEVMNKGKELPVVKAKLSVEKTIKEMTDKKLGCAVVVGNNKNVIGVITDGDIRRHLGMDIMDKTAEDIMTSDPKTVTEDTLVAEAMAIMNGSNSITNIPVVNNSNKLVGLLHMHACLRAGIT